MSSCTPQFSSRRMVREYSERLYIPTLRNTLHMRENGFAAAKSLAEWRKRIAQGWSNVKVESFTPDANGEQHVGSSVNVRATVALGRVEPREVSVQLYHGPSPKNGTIESGAIVEMACEGAVRDGVYEFAGAVPCERSGQQGLAVRVVPRHPDVSGHYDLHMLKWG